jgi:aromatic ring-opening dioxygenase catalytic subunit (LigB family)
MVNCLGAIAPRLRRPSAIVVVSAHWEEDVPTLTSGEHPGLIYDYFGFPEAAYQIRYPCPGDPALAVRMQALLHGAHGPARLDPRRGFDHGLFVPLKLLFPGADIPCVQLSLLNSLSPGEHLALGRQLRGLNQENLLVIGSGFTFHNLREFFRSATSETQAMNEAFEAWLVETCSSASISEAERVQRLLHWEQAPYARYCHPREEHLLPLHVCYGLAQECCAEAFELRILNRKTSMFLWL